MSVLFLPPSAGAASVPDATETTAGKIRIATSAEATAGTNDLISMTPLKVKSVVDAAVVGGVTYQGTFDASSPADLSNASKGDLYIISVAGSYQGQDWAVGDHLLINADMGGTLDPAKIDKVDNTDSVTSVAGRTGAVVLSAGDVSGLATVATSGAYSDLSGTPSLATVATTGAYSDLSGTPSLATVATTGAYSDLSGTPTLGTAAAEDVGTSAGNVVQLNGSAQLPAVDGSLLTNINATIAALDDIGDVAITTPTNTQVIKYNSTSGDWENGAVAYADVSGTPSLATVATTGAYSDLSGTPSLATVATTGAYSDLSGTPTLATVATTGAYSDLSGLPTLGTAAALDVGTSATNVVQLDGSARLPAVDGSQLTNLPSGASTLGALTDVTITGVANTEVIKYNSTSGDWENGAVAYADVSGTPSLATVATTGAYSDLSGTPSLATVATTGAYSDLSGLPTLGTAAALDVGTSANNVVQLNGSAQLPAVDGSQLTGISATVASLNDIGDVSAASPNGDDLLAYNSTSGDWETRAQATNTVVSTTTTAAAIDNKGVNTYSFISSSVTLTIPQATQLNGLAIFNNTASSTQQTISGSSVLFVVSGNSNVSSFTLEPGETRTFLVRAAGIFHEISADRLERQGDVNISSPANGEALIYNSTSGDWENGAVAYADVSGTPTLATVATTGAYSDLSGTPSLATVATTGAYSDLSGLPTLGTAAALDVGTSATNVVQLDGSARLPAVDGSLLTNLPSGGSAPSVTVSSPSTSQTLSAPSGIEEVYIYTPSTAISVNLVAAATCGSGFKYQIKNRSANTITIDPNGSETVDGSTTFALSTQEASLTLITDGSSWFII